MFKYDPLNLDKEFNDPRKVYWVFKLIMRMMGIAFHAKFAKMLTLTCLGRDYNPKSAHYCIDKLICGADIRSYDLTVEEMEWLVELNKFIKPYMDIIIEDERISGVKPKGGNHIHCELNPAWWFKF